MKLRDLQENGVYLCHIKNEPIMTLVEEVRISNDQVNVQYFTLYNLKSRKFYHQSGGLRKDSILFEWVSLEESFTAEAIKATKNIGDYQVLFRDKYPQYFI